MPEAAETSNASSMRILHLLDHSVPLHSGYAFRTLSIVNEQRRRGWETFHLTSPKQNSKDALREEVDGLLFYRTPPAESSFDRYAGVREIALMRVLTNRLRDLAAELRPDILHAHSPALNAIPAIQVGQELGIPVVYEMRALWEDAAVDHGTAREWGLRYRLSRGLESYALRHVQAITTICEGLREDIIERNISRERVTVIPNAVSLEEFSAFAQVDSERAQSKRALGLEGREVLGFAGSFYGYEGLELLIQAVPELLKVRRNIAVLLVGGGPQDAQLRSLVERLNLGNHVIFTGRVPHDQVARHYKAIDVLVYPRLSMRLTELVTPLKPLEAMAMSSVVVASDVGGHRELIRNGETGVLFRAGSVPSLVEVISDLFNHPERWERLRTAGRDFVEKERTWQRSVAAYTPVYEKLARYSTSGDKGMLGRN